ncbi:hypothetical protein BEI59_16030 [Eisenbergiella tayi]|uniref:Uncharacterized protein n=1 Tax=Eisenbergiella tayi TaxID=1432052 RepID=A0A1E3UGH8_9FIRM|nr:hypothetical protein [Eisenbergiella tayi]ODR50363.1 hypothetical protein BEI59_16030 [Eisenbergiella tayi]
MAINNIDIQDDKGNSYRPMANPDSVIEFTKAGSRTNIASGDTHRTVWGKICKFFADLGTAAFCGLANNLSTTAAGYGIDARQGPVIQAQFNQINSDLTALNDAGAIQGMDAREDGVYITYTPVAGADAVTKKLGSTIINLGNGATIDVKAALPNDYAKLTTDNFIAQINSIELGWSTGGRASTTSPKYTLNKSYNPSTGLYTHNAKINRCNADITGGDTRGEGATCWVAISTTTYVIY